MFLFKLSLPLLGTATLGAVGARIYYSIKNAKNEVQENREKVKSQEEETLPKPGEQTVDNNLNSGSKTKEKPSLDLSTPKVGSEPQTSEISAGFESHE